MHHTCFFFFSDTITVQKIIVITGATYSSYIWTQSHTKHTVCHKHTSSNYSGQELKKYDLQPSFHAHMTLKHGHGHHTWYELVDSNYSHNHVKFERPCLNIV